MASPDRLLRVASVIKEEVAGIIAREIAFPDGTLPTVTAVSVSPDMLHAIVQISVYPPREAAAAIKEIERRIWDIQQALNERLHMRPVPKLRFEREGSSEATQRIEQILNDLEEE